MTRTQRNVYPAALAKDRSLSRSGLDKSLPKKGAGAGNWGSFAQETDQYVHHSGSIIAQPRQQVNEDKDKLENDEVNQQQQAGKPSVARRSSSMSEEERKDAAEWRKGALGRQGLDLSAIARTSGAFSQSPPEGESILSSSPVRNMDALAQKLEKY